MPTLRSRSRSESRTSRTSSRVWSSRLPKPSSKKSDANRSYRTAAPARTAPARDQSTPPDTALPPEQALDEIARLADSLCDYLTDDQWRTAE
nr:hypothetical protein [Streptomyces chartreusis]